MWQIWSLPFYITLVTVVLSIPVGFYLAWIMDGKYRAPGWLRWFETRLNTGGQNWKQYTVAILVFSTVMFLAGFAVLQAQAKFPLNPDKPAVALCRCGQSARKPFCDGTHNRCGFQSVELASVPPAS